MTQPVRLARRARLRFDALRGRHMLLWPERGLLLNESGAAIIRLCDGTRAIEDVVDELSRASPDTSREIIDADVRTFLDGIAARGLLEPPR
jgi:pyrroloquinoline quinone biosynthesis protein D